MAGSFYRGVGAYIDHWPATAVDNGDIVVLGDDFIGLALSDIAADAKGALCVQGVWEVPLESGHGVIAEGTDIYWDEDGTRDDATDTDVGAATVDSAGNVYMGKAVVRDSADADDNAAAATDETIWVRVCNATAAP
jgi:predicted RecA/RadA family phage recombinase